MKPQAISENKSEVRVNDAEPRLIPRLQERDIRCTLLISKSCLHIHHLVQEVPRSNILPIFLYFYYILNMTNFFILYTAIYLRNVARLCTRHIPHNISDEAMPKSSRFVTVIHTL